MNKFENMYDMTMLEYIIRCLCKIVGFFIIFYSLGKMIDNNNIILSIIGTILGLLFLFDYLNTEVYKIKSNNLKWYEFYKKEVLEKNQK